MILAIDDCKAICANLQYANLVLSGSSWDLNQTNFTHANSGCTTSIDKVDPVIQAILRADHLSEDTRIGYSKRLALIATAARNKALHPVLTMHPQKVLNWILRPTQKSEPREQ